ncbi:MAG: hypothetical protein GVY28_05105 [Alphaproteobacteria bacterium]|jgi:hypothetical protein|nr:hypothetical protein [Alphaproteobacteria bacterium]
MSSRRLGQGILALLVVLMLGFANPASAGSDGGDRADPIPAVDVTAIPDGSPVSPAAMTPWTAEQVDVAQRCCRICRVGKACGDSCISRSYRCHQPPGCACDG